MGFVGLIIFGGLTLATNRPRGLAMIGGGLVGALLAGLAFTLVNTLTGQSVTSTLLGVRDMKVGDLSSGSFFAAVF